jgi:hypothetical protein
MKGAVLFNMSYLYLSGDPDFHSTMVEAGLRRGHPMLLGMRNKAIIANYHEYWLVDYDDATEFMEKHCLIPCYSVEDFVITIKKIRHENL